MSDPLAFPLARFTNSMTVICDITKPTHFVLKTSIKISVQNKNK